MEYTYIHNHQSQFLEMFGNSEIIELGNVATFINGSAFKPEEWASDGLPIIRIQNLTDPSASYNYYSGTDAKVLIESGDVLVSWSATLDVYLWNQGKAVLNQHIFKVVFDKIGIDKDFFIYTVKSKLAEMVSKAHGSTMKHIVKKDFETTLVPYPSFEKQKEFASIVRQSDKSKFDGFKSQFLEWFGNVTETTSLCEICRPKQWPTIQTKDFTDNGYLVYGANGVIGHYSSYNHEHPTILIACRGASCGAINISEPHSYITGNAMCLDNLSDKVQFEYLAYFLTQYNFSSIISGGAQPQITYTNLQKVEVPIVPIESQSRFVAFYRQADKSKYYVQNKQNYICHTLTNQIQ